MADVEAFFNTSIVLYLLAKNGDTDAAERLAENHDAGLNVAERYGFSRYDSMIVAAALLAACKTLYTADLQHRQVIDGRLTILNLFA